MIVNSRVQVLLKLLLLLMGLGQGAGYRGMRFGERTGLSYHIISYHTSSNISKASIGVRFLLGTNPTGLPLVYGQKPHATYADNYDKIINI